MGSIPEETNQQWSSSTKTAHGYAGSVSMKMKHCASHETVHGNASPERGNCLQGLSKAHFIETSYLLISALVS